MESAIFSGAIVVIEGLDEYIDPVLEPLLKKQIMHKDN